MVIRKLTANVMGYQGASINATLVGKIIRAVESGKLCPGINALYTQMILGEYKRRYLLVFWRAPGEIGGFSAMHLVGKTVYLDLICSSIRGAGRELMVASELIMREKGMRRVRLFAVPPAEGFYKKLGYTETANACRRRPVVKRDGDDANGYRYEKCLGGVPVK